MITFSQNNKIAMGVVAIFAISFSVMVFFLGDAENTASHMSADVLHSEDGHTQEDTGPDYNSYFENEIVFAIDAEGAYTYASDEYCKLIDKKCKKINDHNFFEDINTKDLVRFVMIHTKIMQNGGEVNGEGPFRIYVDDENVIVLLDIKVITENGKTAQLVISVKDITDQVKEMTKDSASKEKAEWMEFVG